MNSKTQIILAIGAIILVYFIFSSVLKRLGIIQSSEDIAKEKKIDQIIKDTSEWSSPQYYKTIKQKQILKTQTGLEKLANIIHKAFHSNIALNIISLGTSAIGTDFESFMGALKQLQSKAQFSQLSEFYANKYQLDLYTDILGELSPDQLITFSEYIERLPNVKLG